jgi:hypothetical protein
MAKENMWGIVWMFGAYAFFFQKHRKLGVALLVVSPVVFLAELWLIPAISQTRYLYTGNYFDLLSASPAAWVANHWNTS